MMHTVSIFKWKDTRPTNLRCNFVCSVIITSLRSTENIFITFLSYWHYSHLTVLQSGYLLYCQSFSMDNSPSSVMLLLLNCPPSVMLPLWNSLSPELEISWVMNQVFASLKKINDMAFKYNYHSEWWICHLWLSVGTQVDHCEWYLAAVYILQDCLDTTLLLVLS